MMKIRMTVTKNGYDPEGTELNVSDERAERWVFRMRIAEFVDEKDRVTVVKKIAAAQKKAEEEDKKLSKRLDKIEAGDGVED